MTNTQTFAETLDTPSRPVLTRAERAQLRLAQQKKHRRIGWSILVVVLLIFGGSAYVVYGTSVLGLKNIAVTLVTEPGLAADAGGPEGTAGDVPATESALADSSGVAPLSAIEFGAPSLVAAAPVTPAGPVLDAALISQVQAAVGVPSGTPLISVDLDTVKAAVEAIPLIAQAQVSRQWPGTLHVAVIPRTPVAVVPANSSLYLLDNLGTPYIAVPAAPAGLVTLRLATPGPADSATLAGLAVVQALPAELIPLLATVSARSAYDISLELLDGRTVQWGGVADSLRKGQILPAVLAQPGTAFDISDPALVTVR